MTFKQTFCVSMHLISKFCIFFRPGGPTVKSRGGLSPHGPARVGFSWPGPARLARRSTDPQDTNHSWTYRKKFIWKVSAGGYPLNKFTSDHSKMVIKFAVTGWVQTMKFFSSQNHIENFVVIIWAVSRLIKPKTDDFRPRLVFWSKSSLFRLFKPS